MREFAPFRGSVRTEDLACQSTQARLDRRREQLGTSDRGVILIRKLILAAIEAAHRGTTPKGVLSPEQGEQIVAIDSFTGIRAKGIC
jgi:hypothetical protein